MKKIRFMIHQDEYVWVIFAINLTVVKLIWKGKAAYPNGELVIGNPDKITQ